jgi:hypothetical protein
MRSFFSCRSLVLPAAALLLLLACSSNQPPSSTAESKPAAASPYAAAPGPAAAPASAPTAPPAGWKTVTNDSKTCRLSLPPTWGEQAPGMGMFSSPKGQEMVMFVDNEKTQKAGNWNPVREEIARKRSSGTKVEILEDSPAGILFRSPQGSVVGMMAFRRSPKTLCVAQISVPAGDPALQKVARQIADSLAPAP